MATPKSSPLELAIKHPGQFLAEQVFRDLYVDEFKFGPGASGDPGAKMISQSVVVPAHSKKGGFMPVTKGNELAIHLNRTVTPSALQNNTLKIRMGQFHLTTRSLATQRTIDAHGPSVITADNSIHINFNTGWVRADNLEALTEEAGVDNSL